MEQEPVLNAHNKEEYPPMHTGGYNIPNIKPVVLMLGLLLFCGCNDVREHTKCDVNGEVCDSQTMVSSHAPFDEVYAADNYVLSIEHTDIDTIIKFRIKQQGHVCEGVAVNRYGWIASETMFLDDGTLVGADEYHCDDKGLSIRISSEYNIAEVYAWKDSTFSSPCTLHQKQARADK